MTDTKREAPASLEKRAAALEIVLRMPCGSCATSSGLQLALRHVVNRSASVVLSRWATIQPTTYRLKTSTAPREVDRELAHFRTLLLTGDRIPSGLLASDAP
jgi:hypothetical protein